MYAQEEAAEFRTGQNIYIKVNIYAQGAYVCTGRGCRVQRG